MGSSKSPGKGPENLNVGLVGLTILALMALPLGCESNVSGDLFAQRVGDLASPAPRARLAEATLDGCGIGGRLTEGSTRIVRHPYLQQVGPESALLLWTAQTDAASSVVVTRVDGLEVGAFDAAVDPAANPRDAVQMQAALAGLEPNTVYCYSVESADGTLFDQTGFRTAPERASTQKVSFVAFGDSGWGGGDQDALLAQMQTVDFDLVVHTGDVAYESGTREQLERTFFEVYEPFLGTVPFFLASGNHDYETADAAPFREVFALPKNGGELGQERWYSFDWGNVHFVALDSEMMGPDQAEWLDADLAATDLPWKVAYVHRGPYSSGGHGGSSGFKSNFQSIIADHGVQLVLSGHDHHYERTVPMYGTTYVVTGGGGRGTRATGQSEFTAFAEAVIHFVYVEVEGDQLTLWAIDATGQDFDSTVLHL